jgi:hypothetical protein
VGFLDAILGGRKQLKAPAPDRLFAMSTAYVKLDTELSLPSSGKAAIVFQPLATADFERIVADMQEIVTGTSADSGTTVTSTDDTFGYRWMVLADSDMEDLVVGVNAVSSELEAGGYGDRVLCAVFAFTGTAGSVYWIYNYKRGGWYPFVPAGPNERSSERELQLKAQVGRDLPMEEDLARWFPLWGIPI